MQQHGMSSLLSVLKKNNAHVAVPFKCTTNRILVFTGLDGIATMGYSLGIMSTDIYKLTHEKLFV